VLKVWQILGVTLLAGTQFAALGSDTTTTNLPAPAAATTLKATYKTSADPVHRTSVKGVRNFGKLNDFIWRSGQPTAEGYKALAGLGLKTVVNLRKEFPGDKDLLPEGVKYVYIPITDEHAPTPEQAKQFLEVASNPENWPLLVHCHGGEGRAAVMAAVVRRSLDGWDFDKTMKETGNFRVKHMGLFTTAMPSCQRVFIHDWAEVAAVAASTP
jgi:protein tyrosine phosphatase (PTP) superfamily phosphohydrolase (DUF442 family)